ncbi:hypothetical protein J2Z37_004545 [Ammoniphilus resinae]|uniref:Uncharacterized protein n=1 Tax=Ammoniphilus resinae TaxID=861532 RepID=A0ABS4GXD1_9BACL|nr:hypothetical protein [Ammoniphilus resinae]
MESQAIKEKDEHNNSRFNSLLVGRTMQVFL